MKKIKYLLLIFLLLLVGTLNVEAKTYANYKEGDKITVNVNDDTKLEFYVMKDSVGEDVTAIYNGVLGEMFYFGPTTNSIVGSIAETKLNELTSAWTNPKEIRLVKANEILPNVEITKDLSEDFTSPSYYSNGYYYWTQDVAVDGNIFYPVVVTDWISYSNLHATQSGAPASEGAIRPVISISKDYVEGGVLNDEETPEIDDTNWKKLKELIKNNETLGALKEEGDDVTFDETDANKITIKVTSNGNNSDFSIIFEYKDGVVIYNKDDNEPTDFKTVHSFAAVLLLNETANLFDYEIESFLPWIGENKKELTLDKHGIEFIVKEYTYDNNGEEATGYSMEKVSINITEPIKGYTNPEVEDNPGTGDMNMVMFIAITVLFSGIALVSYRKMRTN